MKRLFCAICALMLLVGMGSCLTASAAASMTASASASSVTVGQEVTVTVNYDGGTGIGGLQSKITYNAEAFDYVRCEGIEANGGSGTLRLVWYATASTAPTAVSFKVTFKAKAAGAGNFAVSTTEFFRDDNYASLGTPSKTVAVTATNPTLSGNANLKSLKPSTGTLTPAFNANTTAYTIAVPYTTTSLSLSAVAAQSGAKVSVSGSNSLKVGKNTQIITVTAPNGTEKKYTVTITRAAQQATDGQTTTTTGTPEADPLEVEVSGKIYHVADTQPDVTLPKGFVWSPITINTVTVSAAVNEKSGMTLLYLLGDTKENSAFYVYADGEFSPFRTLSTEGALYVLDTPLSGYNIPRGTVSGSVTIGEQTIDAYLFEDEALADVALIFAIGPDGYTGLYVYDKLDGSMQRYREFAVTEEVETEPQEEPMHPILQFLADHRTPLLIGAACVGALALLILAVVLITRLSSVPDDCQH